MKNKYLTMPVAMLMFIVGCNNSNKIMEPKFELNEGEKYIELYYDTVRAEMLETFKFKSKEGKSIDFYISYNTSNQWNEIAKKLVKGRLYGLIYKPFSNQKILDSLERDNIGTDDYPASGDYICYIEELNNVVFQNSQCLITPFIGYWNLSSDKNIREFINIETKITGTGYAFANRGISLKYELDIKNRNILLLYLEQGNYYGQGMNDGYDKFYSTTEPYAELIFSPDKPQELTLTLFGLYDEELKNYVDKGKKNKIQIKKMREEEASF